MVRAQPNDKERITEILTYAFEQNASVNYIVKQDELRLIRIKRLMEYAFKICCRYGKVVLSDDRNACALVQLKKKKFSIHTLLWDIQLIFYVTGIANIPKVLKRESLISKQHPTDKFYYLWFIGVHPVNKGMGAGSLLLSELVADAHTKQIPIYLETSTIKNIAWYEKFGFQVFHKLNFGYNLFFLQKKFP